MGGEISRTIDRRLLGVTRRDGSDAGFADLGLERNFEAARLQPHIEFFQAATGLHADDLAAGGVALDADHLIELAQTDHGSAIVHESGRDRQHRADRIDRRGKARAVAHDGLDVRVTDGLDENGGRRAAMQAPIAVAGSLAPDQSLNKSLVLRLHSEIWLLCHLARLPCRFPHARN